MNENFQSNKSIPSSDWSSIQSSIRTQKKYINQKKKKKKNKKKKKKKKKIDLKKKKWSTNLF